MKKELIAELLEKFENACYVYQGVECWSARELQQLFEYSEWRNFNKVIDSAKDACINSQLAIADHFVETNKMVALGSGSIRSVMDIALIRYACYLIAQNGDPLKPSIAFAQTYFAVQTRKQEIIEQRLLDVARVNAREKLTKSEKKLSGIIFERGIDEKGLTTELTSHNVLEKDLQGEEQITEEHVENNEAVRKMLIERGVKPESLPPAEDVRKVQRRLESDEKQIIKELKKSNR